MDHLFDYVKWRGDLSFRQSAFNEVDALILAELAFIDYSRIVPVRAKDGFVPLSEAEKAFFKVHRKEDVKLGLLVPDGIVELFSACARAPRFAGLGVCAYENKLDEAERKQFCAVTFTIGEKLHYVSFRGTDDTLVGWREDCDMACFPPVPAQLESVSYLERVAQDTAGTLLLGGHSKGGNLAVYAGVCASDAVRQRIKRIYNLDGPGFEESFISSPRYEEMKPHLRTVMPESSVVGAFFWQGGEKAVVRSDAKGLLQHDGFSWEVRGASFVRAEGRSEQSLQFESAMKRWLAQMDRNERQDFVDAVFEILNSSDAKTLLNLYAKGITLPGAFFRLEGQRRKLLLDSLRALIREYRDEKKNEGQSNPHG